MVGEDLFVAVCLHGSDLQHAEGPSPLSDPGLPEEDWSGAIDPDGDARQDDQRCGQHEHYQRNCDVERPFGDRGSRQGVFPDRSGVPDDDGAGDEGGEGNDLTDNEGDGDPGHDLQ